MTGQPDAAPADEPAGRPARTAESGRRRWRLLLSVLVPLAIVGVLCYLFLSHGHELAAAARKLSLGQVAVLTGLAVVSLLARTEAVVASLAAMGERAHRADIHAANSLTFLAAAINHYVSSTVRAWLMKRVDPARSPTILQMFMIDTATTLIEALVVCVLILVSASTLGLAWWIPTLLIVAGVAGVVVALLLRRRFSALSIFRGFDVLADARHRVSVAGLMVIVICTQVARTYVALSAVGLHPNLLQAVGTFVTAGVLSSLFAGPTGGSAGAPLIIFGHSAIAAAAVAGLALSVTTLLAGVLYAVPGAPLFLLRMRRADASSNPPAQTLSE